MIMKNILILSCGTRNKVVQAFKRLDGVNKVICADSSIYAPALYDGDDKEITPKISEHNYLERVFDICIKWNISGLVSLIDPELEIIAKHISEFKSIGCEPMISSLEAINDCFDKNNFSKTLKSYALPTIPSASSISEAKLMIETHDLYFPLMVKPAKGSASVGLNKISDMTELTKFAHIEDELIIQQWMNWQEYGVDCYVDMFSGNLSQMFIKKKLKMRAGETDKAISEHNELIKRTLINFFKNYPFQLKGVIDFDVFCDENNCVISEINPRFGGGYPHAHACGLNYPNLYLNNLNNKINPDFLQLQYKEGIVMMKYNEIMIMNIKDTKL